MMPVPVSRNKFRDAIEALQRGRDLMVDEMADEILDRWADQMMESGYSFNEFLETHGTKLHFLGLLVSQLEVSAEMYEEAVAADPPPPPPSPAPKKPRARSRKLPRSKAAEKKGGEEA